MKLTIAVQSLAALAQETRLRIFRLLVRQGAEGLSAGLIAKRLKAPPATLSFHLKELEQAGLLRSWRVSRNVYYAADIEGMRRLLTFLTEDCCQGNPDICGPLFRRVPQRRAKAAIAAPASAESTEGA